MQDLSENRLRWKNHGFRFWTEFPTNHYQQVEVLDEIAWYSNIFASIWGHQLVQ